MSEPEMTVETRDHIFTCLLSMSDRQFDDLAKAQLRPLLGKPNEEVRAPLKKLLDDIAFAAWSSDFELAALDTVFRLIGGEHERRSL